MQIFQRKFAVTSFIKVYSEVSELCMYPDYDHFYIHLTSTKGKLQPQTNIFPGNNNPSSIKRTVACVEFFPVRYHRLAIRKKVILPLGTFFKTLKDMIIGTAGT